MVASTDMHKLTRTRPSVFDVVVAHSIKPTFHKLDAGAQVPQWCSVLYTALTVTSALSSDEALNNYFLSSKFIRWLLLCRDNHDVLDAMWVVYLSCDSDNAGDKWGFGLAVHDFMEARCGG